MVYEIICRIILKDDLHTPLKVVKIYERFGVGYGDSHEVGVRCAKDI